ncbi:anti-sigma factor [Phenylobacterium sp.]|uniref:anti-sigma factor family protein n=1 Tax=Phenylobacterium sp. TaxID=1871053 RepID=UPI0035B10FFB
MSAHPITEDDLHALVDGQLAAARQAEVEAWLAGHPDAAARVAAYRAQRQAIRSAFADVAEEATPARLNVRTLAARDAAGWGGLQWRAVAAACALLLVGGTAGWGLRGFSQPPGRGIDALAQEAAVSYAVYAPDAMRPIEIPASDRGLLDRWVSQRIGRKVQAPDLGRSGFRLLGGRLVATPHGPAGMFLYENRAGARVALLVRPMEVDKTAAMRRRSAEGTESYAWADDGVGFSVVGEAGRNDLDPLAQEARRQTIAGRAAT